MSYRQKIAPVSTDLFERVDERFDRVEKVIVGLEQVTTQLQQDVKSLYNAINRGAIGIAVALVVAVLVRGG